MVRKQIVRLRKGHTTVDEWILTLFDLDTRDICLAHAIFCFQMKGKYLCIALGIALDDSMPSRIWRKCYNEAVISVNKWEVQEYVKNGETVQIWHPDFGASRSNECFHNPNVYKRNGKPPLPPILDRNPDFKRSVINFAKSSYWLR